MIMRDCYLASFRPEARAQYQRESFGHDMPKPWNVLGAWTARRSCTPHSW
jgi:hypothetical protein